jgi:hypothetical protein
MNQNASKKKQLTRVAFRTYHRTGISQCGKFSVNREVSHEQNHFVASKAVSQPARRFHNEKSFRDF